MRLTVNLSSENRRRAGDSSIDSAASCFRVWPLLVLSTVVAAACLVQEAVAQDSVIDARNPAGVLRTITLDGSPLDTSSPFFQSLGTNGRSCVSCHVPSTGWTVSPRELQRRFDRTKGFDPIFRTNDGSNSPTADVSTLDPRRSAFSMLLNKGLIRIGIGMPAGAEFTLESADDP